MHLHPPNRILNTSGYIPTNSISVFVNKVLHKTLSCSRDIELWSVVDMKSTLKVLYELSADPGSRSTKSGCTFFATAINLSLYERSNSMNNSNINY